MLLRVALAAAGSKLFHILCKLRFFLISWVVLEGSGHGMGWAAFLLWPPDLVGLWKGPGLVPGGIWGVSRLCR